MELLKHVYVINMDNAGDRMRETTENLHRFHVAFTRIPAIDGATASLANVSPVCRMACSRSMIGCALSHARAWQTIIAHGDDAWHLVLEDDARFTRYSIPAFRELEDVLRRRNMNQNGTYIINVSPYLLFPMWQRPGQLDVSPGGSVSTAAYLVTTRAARQLSRLKVFWHVDVVMFQLARTRLFSYKTSRNILDNSGLDPDDSSNIARSNRPIMDRFLSAHPLVRFCMRTTIACVGHVNIDVATCVIACIALAAYLLGQRRVLAALLAYVLLEYTTSSFLILVQQVKNV
jgi:GR25 family glycosyltransferase involved in LPS biosynthesis